MLEEPLHCSAHISYYLRHRCSSCQSSLRGIDPSRTSQSNAIELYHYVIMLQCYLHLMWYFLWTLSFCTLYFLYTNRQSLCYFCNQHVPKEWWCCLKACYNFLFANRKWMTNITQVFNTFYHSAHSRFDEGQTVINELNVDLKGVFWNRNKCI